MPLGKWIVILSTNDIKPKSFIVDLKRESLFQIDLLAKTSDSDSNSLLTGSQQVMNSCHSKRGFLSSKNMLIAFPKGRFCAAITALSPTQSIALRMQELPFYKTKTSLLPFWSIIGLAHSGISSSIFAKLSKEKARFPSNKNWQKSFGHATPAIPIPQRGIAKSALRQQVFERWRNKKAARAFTRAAEYRF